MSRARREPTEEELALWRYVTRDVAPQHPHSVLRTARHPTPEPPPPPKRAAEIIAPPAPTPARPPVRPAPLALGATAGIDRRTAQRFSRGQMDIDAKLDLHGHTVSEAHMAVDRFLRRAAQGGFRGVLLVTGNGGGSEGKGRIRSAAMHWLSHPSLRPSILAVREARSRDGGSGALYVLLRRQRA